MFSIYNGLLRVATGTMDMVKIFSHSMNEKYLTIGLSFSASAYKMVCDVSADGLQVAISDNSTLTMCDHGMVPGQYGSDETCSVTLNMWDTLVFCAITATDDAGNTGDLSNIVTVQLPQKVTTPPPELIRADMDTMDMHLLEIIKHGNYSGLQELLTLTGIAGDSVRSNTTNSIYIATGVMAGVVTVIVVMLIVMIYR